jgi:RNA polymerase primary sigma factor
MIRKIQRARRDMEKEFGRPPSTKELAKHLGISAQKLHHYCSSSRSVLSLENPVRGNSRKQEEKSITLGEYISSDAPTPDEDAESRSLRETMMSVVDELPRIEKEVLLARFGLVDGDSKSIDEIAKKLGISRDRVRISEARALNKLRHPQWNHRLKSYVGGETEDEVFSMALSPEQIWSF